MRVKIKRVNDLVVSDEHMRIMIVKKPKCRYRTIIKAFYKRYKKLDGYNTYMCLVDDRHRSITRLV